MSGLIPLVHALLAGTICAFFGSIPIAGPTAVLIIERALNGKGWEAFEVALGASAAECGYATLAYLGMTAFLGTFPWILPVSRVLGALILVGLGLYFALSRRARAAGDDPGVEVKKRTPGAMLLLGVVVTGVNPTLLASWSVVTTMLHSTGLLRIAPIDALPFGLGVCIGGAAWFALFIWILHHYRRRVRDATLEWTVRIMGVLMTVGGAVWIGVLIHRWR